MGANRVTKKELIALLWSTYDAIQTVRLDNTRAQRVSNERPDNLYWKGMAQQAVCIDHKLADSLRDSEESIREVLGLGGELTMDVKQTINQMATECGLPVPFPDVEASC